MFTYRDFGGIKNKENKTIRKNMIIRSSNLNKINFITKKYLLKIKLSKIIDLRTDTEVKEKPDVKIKNTKYIHLPIFNESMIGITHEKDATSIELLEKSLSMTELYKMMVTSDFSVSQLKKIINEIVKSNEYGILFHCTIGKDRTGLVSMIILSILDVDIETIISNYLHNNFRNIAKANIIYHFLKLKTKNKEISSKAKSIYLTDKNYLLSAINAINEKYGNMDNFIKNILEISNNDKELFKSKILK